MALNFPNSPTNGQAYLDTASGNRYVYDSANTLWKYASNNSLVASSNNQVIYNSNGGFTGSNGLTFSANTLYANTVNVTGYLYGNGAFLTGVSTSGGLANTSGISFNGNLYFPSGNVAIGNTTSIQKFEVVGNMAVSNFYENDINVASNVTITTGRNAMSAGPITINNGVVVTVPSGSTWTIV